MSRGGGRTAGAVTISPTPHNDLGDSLLKAQRVQSNINVGRPGLAVRLSPDFRPGLLDRAALAGAPRASRPNSELVILR